MSHSVNVPGELESLLFFSFFNHYAPIGQANWCNMTFTAGNLFPSHSSIGWPESSHHWDSNLGPQLERRTTYQLSYSCPLINLKVTVTWKQRKYKDMFHLSHWLTFEDYLMYCLRSVYGNIYRGHMIVYRIIQKIGETIFKRSQIYWTIEELSPKNKSPGCGHVTLRCQLTFEGYITSNILLKRIGRYILKEIS